MNPIPTWMTGAFVILGGIATLNVASTLTLKALHFVSENKRVKIAIFSTKKSHCFIVLLILMCFLEIGVLFVEKNSVAV